MGDFGTGSPAVGGIPRVPIRTGGGPDEGADGGVALAVHEDEKGLHLLVLGQRVQVLAGVERRDRDPILAGWYIRDALQVVLTADGREGTQERDTERETEREKETNTHTHEWT